MRERGTSQRNLNIPYRLLCLRTEFHHSVKLNHRVYARFQSLDGQSHWLVGREKLKTRLHKLGNTKCVQMESLHVLTVTSAHGHTRSLSNSASSHVGTVAFCMQQETSELSSRIREFYESKRQSTKAEAATRRTQQSTTRETLLSQCTINDTALAPLHPHFLSTFVNK